jgi:hypothetical protein
MKCEQCGDYRFKSTREAAPAPSERATLTFDSNGDYWCSVCGPLGLEPCEHWRSFLVGARTVALPRVTTAENRVQQAMAKTVDYISRDAVSNNNNDLILLAQELAKYCLQSFSLQTSEHGDAVRLRNICYTILRTKGHDAKAAVSDPESAR